MAVCIKVLVGLCTIWWRGAKYEIIKFACWPQVPEHLQSNETLDLDRKKELLLRIEPTRN